MNQHQSAPLKGFFVTGTDTDAGKTCVSTALLHALTQAGWRGAGFKPVAAGTSLLDGPEDMNSSNGMGGMDGIDGPNSLHAQRVNDDVRALRNASAPALRLSDAEVGPFQFHAACAPHIAAALQGQRISRAALLNAARTLAARADALVVEGAGGFCVPLGEDWDSADLAVDLQLPVLLVVGLRLGCINHALLSAEAVRARGLRLAGWVGNCVSPDMPWRDENIATLRQRFDRQATPCLGIIPWLAEPSAAAVAEHFDPAALAALFSPLTSS